MRLIQLVGLVVTLGSLWLIYGFVLSQAWFGVMIALFVVAVGLKATLQPDIIRFGKAPDVDERSRYDSDTPEN